MNTASNASPKFELSPVQLIAGCLAAVTAAVLASFFGVAGTIIGTALGSIVGTAGTALYTHSIRTTQARLHTIRTHESAGSAAAAGGGDLPADRAGERAHETRHVPGHPGWQHYLRRNWVMIAVAATVAFVLSMTAVTGVEAAARKQLWAIVTGHSQPAGPTTTLGGVVGGVSAQPTPTATATAEPSANPSPGAPAAAPTSTPGGSTLPASTSPTATAIPTVPPPTTGPTASP
jgi:hypothetical protein